MTSPQIELVHLLLAGAPLPEEGPVAELARAHPDGVAQARALIGAGIDPPTTPEGTAALFDRLAALSPEAAVAIYSLGDPELLDAATAELVEVIEAWLLSPAGRGHSGREPRAGEGARRQGDRHRTPSPRSPQVSRPLPAGEREVLDFGCGIGRVARALAARGARVTGIDVSPAMIEEARRRGGGADYLVANSVTGLPDERFDLIVAADSFPYLVSAGLIDAQLADMARVLRPGGRLMVFNWSYRGNPALDSADAERLAAAHGLALLRAGERPFRIWDASGFLLEKLG